MFCGHCGQLNPDTNTHCDSCGKEIRLAFSTTPATARGQEPPVSNVQTYSGPPATEPGGIRFIFFNQSELRAGWRLLIYAGMAILIATVLGIVLRGLASGVPGTITPVFVIVQEVVLILMVVVPALVMARFERRKLADYGLPLRSAFSRNFWLGAAWGIMALTLVLLVLRMNGSFIFGNVGLGWKQALWYGALWAVAMYLVGIAEEFMLRGYSQFTLTTGLGFWPAAALLSLVFAALHLPNPGETKLGISSVVAIGLFFAFTLYRTGSLWFAIGMHASWNWGQTFFYGVPNSGMVAQGHLLNPVIQGPAWYTGGTAGPEGSILIFPLIALLFVVFHRTFPKGTGYPVLVPAPKPVQDAVLG